MKRIESIIIDKDQYSDNFNVTAQGRASQDVRYFGEELPEVEAKILYDGPVYAIAVRIAGQVSRNQSRPPKILNLVTMEQNYVC